MTGQVMRALGMMSGTSLDGVDAALIETDGVRIAGFGRSAYRAYSGNESAMLHAALGQWPGDPDVAEAADLSVAAHAALAEDFPEAELLGYHGQTLAHDPGGRGTHQAGDGAALARRLGRPVVWDFRSEDMRRGGEGAPLAPFFHWACAEWAMGQGHLPAAPVAFLNLGGVGNLTWVDPAAPAPEAPGACIAFDTGPANAPLNDLMRARRGLARDEGGALAASGRPDEAAIARFLTHPHFARPLPKSLDRDAFPDLAAAVAHLADRLKGYPGLANPWPADHPGLRIEQRKEMQRLLTARGFDTQGIDGNVGSNTIAAIRAYQASRGLPVTGEPNAALLEQLRRG